MPFSSNRIFKKMYSIVREKWCSESGERRALVGIVIHMQARSRHFLIKLATKDDVCGSFERSMGLSTPAGVEAYNKRFYYPFNQYYENLGIAFLPYIFIPN